MPSFDLGSRRKALALSAVWWFLRHKLRQRAAATAAGLLAGEGLAAFAAPPPKKRHRLRNLMLLLGTVAAGFVVWRKLRGAQDDDWGGWEPEAPTPVSPFEPVSSTPEPDPAPAAA
jgi:hypothetical protein